MKVPREHVLKAEHLHPGYVAAWHVRLRCPDGNGSIFATGLTKFVALRRAARTYLREAAAEVAHALTKGTQ